jgi:hypothetical protein
MVRRTIVSLLIGLTMLVGVAALPAQAADRVRCDFRGSYHVVCYNNTPYRVHVRLKLFTEAGLRIRYFTIFNYSHSVYSPSYINRITWRWNY